MDVAQPILRWVVGVGVAAKVVVVEVVVCGGWRWLAEIRVRVLDSCTSI